jgi:hypothetical protein
VCVCVACRRDRFNCKRRGRPPFFVTDNTQNHGHRKKERKKKQEFPVFCPSRLSPSVFRRTCIHHTHTHTHG